jgi:hypothetical protein
MQMLGKLQGPMLGRRSSSYRCRPRTTALTIAANALRVAAEGGILQ